MGFGALFIGYVVTYIFSIANLGGIMDTVEFVVMSIITNILGVLIMIYALRMLKDYNKFFKYSLYSSYALLVSGALNIVMFALSDNIAGYLGDVLGYVKAVVVFVFHILLLKGISVLANDVELPKIVKKSRRNTSFTLVYFVSSIFLLLPFPENIASDINLYVKFPVLFIGIIWLVLNAALLYSCYMWICLEGDEDMEVKKSRFEFVNKLNSKLSNIEDKAYKKKNQSAKTEPPNTGSRKKKKKNKK